MNAIRLFLAVMICVGSSVGLVGAIATDALQAQFAAIEFLFGRYLKERSEDTLYFVELGGRDPSDAFISEVSTSRRRISRRSEASYSREDGARSKVTGERGVIICISDPKWVDEDHYEVTLGYQVNGLGGAGGVYVFDRTPSGWRAGVCKREWVD